MKKILSFLLAASLVLGVSAVGFAEGEPVGQSGATATGSAATLLDKPEGSVLKPKICINETEDWNTLYTLKSAQKPVSVEYTLEGRQMDASIRSIIKVDALYEAKLSIDGGYALGVTIADLDRSFAGEIKVYWEDGSFSSWPVNLSVSDRFKVHDHIVDEQGNTVSRSKLEIGKTYIFKIKLKDLNNRLQKDGHKTLGGEWTISNGSQRIKLLNGPGESLKDGDTWRDTATYELSGNGGEVILPFEMKFTPVATGKFSVQFGICLDDSDHGGTGFGMSYRVIDTITDGSDLIDIVKDVQETDSEVVVSVDTNKKISAEQFEALQKMAKDGKPVSIKLANTSGIQMKLDIPSTLPQGFLDDLAAKNNGKFDPSVNLRIPSGADPYVSAHGQWVDFMYTGRLPGKMTVTVDIPKGTFQDNVNELTAWWYDKSTHRAQKEGVTVSFDKVAGTATFTIDHCSAWGLFPVGYDPNLGQKPDTGSSDDDDSDSDSSSGSSEEDFSWASARSRVKSAKAGSTVRMSVPAGEKIPASLLRALAEKQDVTLVLRQNGKSLKILSSAVGDLEKKEYRFSELQALFGGQAASGGETAAEDADKTNPGTGASDHMGAALLLSACGLLIVRRLRG